MDQPEIKLSARAERNLCLAHAFLPPKGDAALEALRDDLIADLEEIFETLGVRAEALRELAEVLQAVERPESLMITYSRLFLAPPAPALLNLGFYMDGALMGHTCQDIERLYQGYGLERDAHFKDTADHLALYLQFLGWLMAEAEERRLNGDAAGKAVLADLVYTLERHALPAIERLHAHVLKAETGLGVDRMYGILARITCDAVRDDMAAIRASLPRSQPGVLGGKPSLDELTGSVAVDEHAVACASCSKSFVADSGLAHMVTVLAAQGLDTAHLRVCPACRAGSMGMTALKAPTLKKAS